MKFDTRTAAGYAADNLDKFLARAQRDTIEILQTHDIPTTVAHFAQFRDAVRDLQVKIAGLEQHIKDLSYDFLPTMMGNQNVKTITVEDVGRVSVNVRWSASMLNKERSMEWLRTSGNEGLIIETVNAGTLSNFAKIETLDGRPLPTDLFRVGTAQHISITKNGGSSNDD